MTDLNETSSDTAAPASMVSFALKNGAGTVEIDTGRLPDDVYREALLQGLKVLAERNMSKLTKAAYPDDNERKAAIKAKAEANIQDMYAGHVKIAGAPKAKKTSGAIMTEAMRIARNLVKDAMKAEKIKIVTVKPSEITLAAKALIESDASILATAEENLKARSATPAKIDIRSLIKVDPELEAKEAARAQARANKPLSAKQAGKVAPRVKGSKPAPQANA